MKSVVAVIAMSVAIVAGGAAALSVQKARQQQYLEQHVDPEVALKATTANGSGRIFLSDAQVAEALRSGTIRRPVKSVLNVREPLRYGEFVWNTGGAPKGQVWISVDLKRQILSVFRSGHEIGTAVILHGADSFETPSGSFEILAKNKNYWSSTYDAPMPFALRLTSDGVAIHGSDVRWGAATHGCIGVPPEFAKLLFEQAHVGDSVTVTGSVPPV